MSKGNKMIEFKDKFGKDYSFSDYMSFASWWFGWSRKAASYYFPGDFKRLQKLACSSKEARSK